MGRKHHFHLKAHLLSPSLNAWAHSFYFRLVDSCTQPNLSHASEGMCWSGARVSGTACPAEAAALWLCSPTCARAVLPWAWPSTMTNSPFAPPIPFEPLCFAFHEYWINTLNNNRANKHSGTRQFCEIEGLLFHLTGKCAAVWSFWLWARHSSSAHDFQDVLLWTPPSHWQGEQKGSHTFCMRTLTAKSLLRLPWSVCDSSTDCVKYLLLYQQGSTVLYDQLRKVKIYYFEQIHL